VWHREEELERGDLVFVLLQKGLEGDDQGASLVAGLRREPGLVGEQFVLGDLVDDLVELALEVLHELTQRGAGGQGRDGGLHEGLGGLLQLGGGRFQIGRELKSLARRGDLAIRVERLDDGVADALEGDPAGREYLLDLVGAALLV
jgi:hypothetical protein